MKTHNSKKVSGNNGNHDKVEVDITTKKNLSDSYIAKEAEFVIQVREAVQKLGKGALVEVNSGLMEVVSHMVRTRLDLMGRALRRGVVLRVRDEFVNSYSGSKKSIGALLLCSRRRTRASRRRSPTSRSSTPRTSTSASPRATAKSTMPTRSCACSRRHSSRTWTRASSTWRRRQARRT